MIKEKVNVLANREKIEKLVKYKEPESRFFTVKSEKEKLYDYYKCDYCGEDIKINKKWEQKEGGIVEFKASLTKTVAIKLALHNRCLKLAMKEFE